MEMEMEMAWEMGRRQREISSSAHISHQEQLGVF